MTLIRETVAVVGPTGSGKTTIMNLIKSLHWMPAVESNLAMALMCVILQPNLKMPMVYCFTRFKYRLLEQPKRICGRKPTASREEVITAAKRSEYSWLYRDAPEGYDVIKFQGKFIFSTGLKQLISIAEPFTRLIQKILILMRPLVMLIVVTELKFKRQWMLLLYR